MSATIAQDYESRFTAILEQCHATAFDAVSRNVAMVKLLAQQLGISINVSPDAHFIGALGAALFAHDRAFGGTPRIATAVAEEA